MSLQLDSTRMTKSLLKIKAMEKNTVFAFTAPNGVEITGVVVDTLRNDVYQKEWLCYAQNKLFYYWCHSQNDYETGELCHCYSYGGIAVDYCVLPDYDAILEEYQHQLDMANDYADKTV